MGDRMCTTTPEAGTIKRRKVIAAIFAATLMVAGCSGPKGGGQGTTTGNGNPAKSGPTQKILLVWNKAKGEWKVKLNGGNAQDPKSALTTLDRNTTGPTMFEVSIDGGGSAPPTFTDDALWVWEGKGLKSSPKQGINSTQVLGPMMNNKGNLIFWDLNQGDAVTLNYQFNFKNGIPPVDPIIDNGGHD